MKLILIKLASVFLISLPISVYQPDTSTHEVGPSVPTINLETLKPLKVMAQPQLKEQATVQPLNTPKPPSTPTSAGAASAGGCVTGYFPGPYSLNQLISHESGGRSCAENPGGCFGLLQACPGSPLKAACGGNPSCQITWFIQNKTGGRSWDQIWALWQTQGWW